MSTGEECWFRLDKSMCEGSVGSEDKGYRDKLNQAKAEFPDRGWEVGHDRSGSH